METVVREIPIWCVVVHIYGHGLSGECQIQTATIIGAIAEVLGYMTQEERDLVETVVVTRLYKIDA